MDAKTQARVDKLLDLGLIFNGTDFLYQDINFNWWSDVLFPTDEEFEKNYAGAVKRKTVIDKEKANAPN